MPSETDLLRASSLLALDAESRKKSYAAQIAYDEYCYLLNQTYFFEVLGFQVLSTMALAANSFSFLHEIAAQAVDEARHIELYGNVIKRLDQRSAVSPSIPLIFQTIANSSSLPEKAVKGFLVLESLAVGLFGARIKMFPSSPLTEMDRIIVAEEAEHQAHAVTIMSSFINEGLITFEDVTALMHEGVSQLALEIMPFEVAERHSLNIDVADARRLLNGGILKTSATISRSNIRRNLAALRLAARK